MKYAKLIDGRPVWAPSVLRKDGNVIANPSASRLRAEGYKEVIYPAAPAPGGSTALYSEEADCIRVVWQSAGQPAAATSYEQRVEALIRGRYTVSDELAILRQRDTKPGEFAAYDAFCEECKRQAKELGNG